MTPDDRRLLTDIHDGLPLTFYEVYFSAEGCGNSGCGLGGFSGSLEAEDLPPDIAHCVDAVPKLEALVQQLEAQVRELEHANVVLARAFNGNRSPLEKS